MRSFASVSGADKTFGLRDKDGKFNIGNKEAKVKENNIFAGEREYGDTPGLRELIVTTTPDGKIFTNEDYDNYAEIKHLTNALWGNNDESETKPKANKKPTKAGNGSTCSNHFGMKIICVQETVKHLQFPPSF